MDAVPLHSGRPFTDGPGAVVTSFDPQPRFVDLERPPEGGRLEIVVLGPLAMASAFAARLSIAEVTSERTCSFNADR